MVYSFIVDEITETFRAQLASGNYQQPEGTNDPLGDALRKFDEELGLHASANEAQSLALAMHQEYMKSQGKAWDDTPVAEEKDWWDQDMEFTSMDDLNTSLTKKELPSVAVTIRFNEASIEEYLHNPDGPVGRMLGEIGKEMTGVAEARVPYMKPENYSWSLRKSTQYMPWLGGWTASTIWYHPPANDSQGRLYAGTNVWYGPTLWLERGRSHPKMKRNRFMTDALNTATI